MALDDFWLNVSIAARSFIETVRSDSPHFDSDHWQMRLRTAAPWLTPASVEGFDARDFTLLPQSERERLTGCVEAFRRVAETVPDDGPATREQENEARASLECILEILRPDRNPDVEAFRASKILENLRFPDVVKLIWEFDTDVTGDPAIRVWVILKDEVAKRSTFFEEAVSIRDQIDLALRRRGIHRWPYIHVRSNSEQRSLERHMQK
jgi:hypothetical protein